MEHKKQYPLYLMLDSGYVPLARGLLLSPPAASSWQVRVLDGKIDEVMCHETLQLVCASDQGEDLVGRITGYRKDVITVTRLRRLGSEVRENLRMPTDFHSFIYPCSGPWTGRRAVQACDLSCGGIAFYCQEELGPRERLEIVVPITVPPLILRCEVLRRRPSDRSAILYAAKFINMCNDEETMVRRAVFHIQLFTKK
jgi:hypothetical protein